MMAGNSRKKKTVGLYVPTEYPFKGKEVKKELDDFIQWLWDKHKILIKKYPKIDKIKKITGGW